MNHNERRGKKQPQEPRIKGHAAIDSPRDKCDPGIRLATAAPTTSIFEKNPEGGKNMAHRNKKACSLVVEIDRTPGVSGMLRTPQCKSATFSSRLQNKNKCLVRGAATRSIRATPKE